MNYGYLDQLALTEAEKSKLRSLGAPSATALRAIISASPEAFVNLLGKTQTRRLTQALDAQLTEDERGLARTPIRSLPATGALISRTAPRAMEPNYDVQLRDQLFVELQALRTQEKSEEVPDAVRRQAKQKISRLERRLNTLLETA